ncbi:hypothetical protein [Ferviditalea candida]|uniref:Uncharacterized protein n=1 Tax=Ferviditalea candida TaxID=3108399 RepID=A0ABU5ZII9_9BACL|nr:hypothetical protein [Paenibacillaceae bacterium T2]
MSLKSIDVQLALSRNNETGNLQNQLAHKPVEDQISLNAAASKKTEEMRKKSAKAEEVLGMLIQDDGRQDKEQQNRRRRKAKDSEPGPERRTEPVRQEHPYKGHHIDFSL